MNKTLTILLTLFLCYTSAYAHSGRTDSKGGHTDKAGEYHYHSEAKEVEREGQYVKYSNGIVYDEKTGLEWYVDPNVLTTWYETKEWVENLLIAGVGWRMPTKKELSSLYKEYGEGRTISTLFTKHGWWVWSAETKGSDAHIQLFSDGPYTRRSRYDNSNMRGFAVRSRKLANKKLIVKNHEKDYQKDWCKLQHGQTEYMLPNYTRVDCLTELYAIEFDFAKKWAEAIGQSLYYASMTDKKPGIVLIYEKDTDTMYLDRINKVIEENKLPIRIWVLNERLDK